MTDVLTTFANRSYPIVLKRLHGHCSRPILQETFLGYSWESNPGTLGWQPLYQTGYIKIFHISLVSLVHSFPNTTRGYRRLSLAALVGLPAVWRGIILMLLPNTRSVISGHFASSWSRASTYFRKVEMLAFTDCDYHYTLVL